MNRPDPVQLARYSFYLAIGTIAIMAVAFILGMARVRLPIIWLGFITSGVGLFFAYAARTDFKKQPGTPEAMKQLGTAWRVNLWALILLLVALVIGLVFSLLTQGLVTEEPAALLIRLVL